MAESVVDYDAWRKGYMPPSEHFLIHELSYGNAKIIMSSDWGASGFWLVTRGGKNLKRKQRLVLFEMLHTIHDDDHEHLHPLAAEYGVPAGT